MNDDGFSVAGSLFEGLFDAVVAPRSSSQILAAEFAFPDGSEVVEYELHCSVTVVDVRGRLAARGSVRQLGWAAGQQVSVGVNHGVVVVRRSRHGRRLSPAGFVVLPSGVRNQCRLRAGDRVLLAASLKDEVLVVYPPRALAAALREHRPDLWGRGR
ncbi:AbrB/MazE/SpoVT family DNA-binding domain-containing protein [Nocardia sp. NPDC001965]